jgi:asparagine synthase (glutamine-hydrolysing)
MCGISAIVGTGPVNRCQIEAMTHRLTHRGPDAGGIWQEGRVALGHRRLSIIDLEGGQQPMSNEDGTLWIVCNGEIYNHVELRGILRARGHHFKTRSDTEVILHLYEEYGRDCLRHLRGMFSFALWDSRKQRLFAARDHLGQKPLYYAVRGQELLLASEIKALLAADPSLRQLDLAALDEYLSLRVVSAPRSMFRDIRKLPPAHALVFDPHAGLEVYRYWTIDYGPKWSGTDEQLVEELEHRLIEAVRLHLVSDVPVGAFLSGGLDSSLIVAIARKYRLIDDLQTFSLGLPYGDYDEAPTARLVATTHGTHHRERQVKPSLLHALPRLVDQLDEPSDPLAVCVDLVAELAAHHVKVVLGGDGGDELFGGYDRYYGNCYAARYARIPGPLRRGVIGPLLSHLPDGDWYKSVSHQLKWLHRLASYKGGDRYRQSLAYFYFNEDLRLRLHGPRLRNLPTPLLPGWSTQAAYDAGPAEHMVDRMLYADLQSRLPDHPVMVQDRMTMAYGLEARSPFMDHRLVEFAARLPVRLKVRGRTLRYAQVKLAERLLPPEVLRRKKQGFSSALPYLLKAELDHLYHHFLPRMELARDDLVEQPVVNQLLQEHQAGADHSQRLWLLVNAEVWYRMFIGGTSRSDLEAELTGAPAIAVPTAA